MQTLAIPPEVQAAIDRGDKVVAIKLLRNATGLGLKEAKDVVEQIEVGGSSFTVQSKDGTMANEEIVKLLQQGNKLEAIRLYRQQNGVGLKEAKDAIEAMPECQQPVMNSLSPGQVKKSSNFMWITVAIVVGVVVAFFYLRPS